MNKLAMRANTSTSGTLDHFAIWFCTSASTGSRSPKSRASSRLSGWRFAASNSPRGARRCSGSGLPSRLGPGASRTGLASKRNGRSSSRTCTCSGAKRPELRPDLSRTFSGGPVDDRLGNGGADAGNVGLRQWGSHLLARQRTRNEGRQLLCLASFAHAVLLLALGQHLGREQLQGSADVLVAIAARLLQQDDLIDPRCRKRAR